MKKNIIYIVLGFLFLSRLSSPVLAGPAAPVYGVNHKTRECTIFFMGDECLSCKVPENWEGSMQDNCPADYKQVQQNADCTRNKSQFCCSIDHSGMMGDCEDVLVNDSIKLCAFVQDINECDKLPDNWQRVEEVNNWGKICPSFDYAWNDEYITCEKISMIGSDSFTDQLPIFLATALLLILVIFGLTKFIKSLKK